MNKNHLSAAAQNEPADKKQIRMNVDGCTVKLNLSSNKSEVGKIETVKRMILNGLAKV